MRAERRRTSRRPVNLKVEQCTGAVGKALRATNLSIDGLRLDESLSVAPGAVVDMVVHVPGERAPLRVRGTVVDAGRGTGVEFMRLTTRDRLQIAEFLFG